MLPPNERLRKRESYQLLFQEGRKVQSRSFLLLWHEGGGARRAGFTLSRRIRGAVLRNKARRRVREAYRTSRAFLPQGIQIVFVIRGEALTIEFWELLEEVQRALQAVGARSQVR